VAIPEEFAEVTAEGAVIRRIRVRSVWIGVVLSAGAFLFGWRRGVTLTICAAVVIFSFLIFEKLTVRLVTPQEKWRIRALLPLLLVTAAAVALLLVVFHWKAFDPIAGAIGLSTVVMAIGAEIWSK
jgi:peptidoglycan biosynthesis protein MviN/MurJ (putative lipid II flippase)